MRKRARLKATAEINIVPYIDVMLVLLVIFMVTAPLLQEGVAVDLPSAQAKTLPPRSEPPVVVSVTRQGQLFLNIAADPSQPVSPNQMATTVRAALVKQPDRPVMVKGDAEVSYAKVVQAMTWLQQAGAPSVGLVTQSDTMPT